ncbi:MAG: flagellar type III secretion system pore protein FliP [Acidimicrobiales bacterium]
MADRPRASLVRRLLAGALVVLCVVGLAALAPVGAGHASASSPAPTVPDVPQMPEVSDPFDRPSNQPVGQADGADSGDNADASIDVSFPKVTEDSSNSVVIILLLTVLSIAPSLMVLCTSFTRIVIVLSLTRNALGIPTVPPQQVVVGLSVFLTLFVMGPTLGQMKEQALDPLLDGKISTSEALDRAEGPLREFLLDHTREGELEMFLDASGTQTPVARDEVPLNALIPAFVLSELKSGFIIGFVIFIPFLIIDLVVSAVLMALGMMMLPPSFVSLPFKLLLFVMLDGWMLVVGTLLTSYN